MNPRTAGFTLLEITLTLAIGMVLILLAVPSIAGVLAGNRLRESFDHFALLANTARTKSVQEQRAYHIVWQKPEKETRDERAIEVFLEPAEVLPKETATRQRIEGTDGVYALERVAALVERAPAVWTFWSSGTCEPVIVSYHGAAGTWRAQFDPLTAHGKILESTLP